MTDPSSLIAEYIADLADEIEQVTRQVASGRADLYCYLRNIKTEYAILHVSSVVGTPLAMDRYGVPSIEAGRMAQREILQILAAVIKPHRPVDAPC